MARKRVRSVAVYWWDATFKMDGHTTPALARTYGELLECNDKHVLVNGETFTDGQRRQVTSIPRGMVLRIVQMSHLEPAEFGKEAARGAEKLYVRR